MIFLENVVTLYYNAVGVTMVFLRYDGRGEKNETRRI